MMVRLSPLRSISPLVALGLAVLSQPAAVFAAGFSAIELPPVETRLGEFADIEPTGIDRRGRVVGYASKVEEESPGAYGYWVGFRFYPRSGMSRLIDPIDGLHTHVLTVNERGTLYGEAFLQSPRTQELFLHADKTGFDLLENGSSAKVRRAFQLHFLTGKGNLSGTVVESPFLYLRDQGWIDLWDRYEPVAEYVERVLVNDVGDFALQTFEDTFVSSGSGELERIGPDGFDVLLEALGKRHQVIGSYKRQPEHKFDRGGPNRPYVFSRKEGFVDILADGLRRGVARWISKSGVIYGTAKRDRVGDTLFRRDPDGSLETVDLERAFNDAIGGYTFRAAEVIDVNNRGQLVAEVRVRPRNLTTCWGVAGNELFLYFDRQQGFVNLQEAVDDAGLDHLLIFDIVGLNDGGHIIARACRKDGPVGGLPWAGVLLRPR